MTLQFSADLQAVVFQALKQNADLRELVGEAVFDEPPQDVRTESSAYVILGEETVRPFETQTSQGSLHDFDVTVHSGHLGFDIAKRVAGVISAALADLTTPIEGGQVVDIRFLRARAQRGRSPITRTIALRFRAVIDGI
ncbi:MAG: DUF3168 domain-containing protein [Pseudomonadota bacterium]